MIINIENLSIINISYAIGGAIILGAFFVKGSQRIARYKNTLKRNKAGGDIAGSNIHKSHSNPLINNKSKHQNKLDSNTANGDIAGGDIEK